MILLKNHTLEELLEQLAPAGVPRFMAQKLQAAAVREDRWLPGGAGLSPHLLAHVRSIAEIPRLTLLEKVVSPTDGFARYVFRGEGPEPFEAVRIPLSSESGATHYAVCVSSQVGCGMGCVFCCTGRMGFRRNLSTWEIIDQVVRIRMDSPHPIRRIVFMGMGEPLLNYDAVMRAVGILTESCGMAMSRKAITVSTSGIVPGIRRLTAEKNPPKLIVSLSCADPRRRGTLMPVENTWSTGELMQAIRAYHEATKSLVTLAWTMIAGVNTTPGDARQLAELTRGLPFRLELIDVNDPSGRFRPPTQTELDAFRDALRAEHIELVTRRTSGGIDIRAACGLLAGGGDHDRNILERRRTVFGSS
ncbi:MAG TPA: radical SAM protein [Candidatus Ozemobacteraceae bacterium]|nr:radical SAM protein [Candidatus Ozemobacteraceae bacterium]